jgi:hypothetical protein
VLLSVRWTVATATALLVAAAVAAPANGRGSERVYVNREGCGSDSPRAYEPRTITLSCLGGLYPYATDILYRHCGTRLATASAELSECVPSAAPVSRAAPGACPIFPAHVGLLHTYPGTLRLSDIVRCPDGKRFYGRISFRDATRSGYTPHGTDCIPRSLRSEHRRYRRWG